MFYVDLLKDNFIVTSTGQELSLKLLFPILFVTNRGLVLRRWRIIYFYDFLLNKTKLELQAIDHHYLEN